MSLIVTIDDFTPTFQPGGLDDISCDIKFNYGERTLLKEINGAALEFYGDAYDYLFNSFKQNRYNGVHSVTISKRISETAFNKVFSGLLFISDCEFDIDKKTCSVEIIERTYASYIKNNQGIETNFTIGKTKNGETISTPTPVEVELINPPSNTVPATGLSTAVTMSTSRFFYPLKEVLTFLTGFASDNNVSLQSTYLDNIESQLNVGIGIIQGRNLRTNESDVNGLISFEGVFNDVSKLLNLILSTDTSTATSLLLIENAEYFQNEEVIIKRDNVKDIKLSFVQELLFSNVNVGSKDSVIDGSVGALTYIPPFDFNKDSYYVAGLNNLNTSLELSLNTFITDSNIIEDIIVNNNNEYDEDWFLITYNPTTLEAWTPACQIFSDGFYYYNGDFINNNIVKRYSLQGALVRTQGNSDGDFVGLNGSTTTYDWASSGNLGLPYAKYWGGVVNGQTITGKFNNVISDPSGAWSTSTNRYTAAASGVRNLYLEVKTNLQTTAQIDNLPQSIHLNPLVYMIMPRFKVNGSYYNATNIAGVPPSYLEEVTDFTLYLGDNSDTMHLMEYEATTERFERTIVNSAIYLEAGDYLEIEYGYFVAFMKNTDLAQQLSLNNSLLMKDLPAWVYGFNGLYSPYENYLFAGTGLLNVLPSSSLIISAQGSVNGVSIGASETTRASVNKYVFEEVLSAKEIYNLLNSPQKSLLLKNNNNGINSKLWAYAVSINLKSGKTSFEMFNNIGEL